jgi:hypothetical protein
VLVPSADAKIQQTQQKNAELTARLEVRERINAALVTGLEQEKRELEQQLIQLAQQSKAYELEKAQLLAQVNQFCEANVLGARQATCRFISCSGAPFLLVNGDLNDRVALGVQRDCRDRCPVARMA